MEVKKGTVSSLFGPKRDEVIGGWIQFHNEELHNLYSSPSIIRGERDWQGMQHEWGKRNAYRILV
jgi:hypothetical protein